MGQATEQCFVKDGGRPSEIGIQVLVSNHLWVLWSKAMVLSAEEKRAGRTGQVSALKLNESEQLMKRRYTLQMQVGTEDFVGSSGKVWRKPDY